MKKIVIPIMIIHLLFAYSCKKSEKSESDTPGENICKVTQINQTNAGLISNLSYDKAGNLLRIEHISSNPLIKPSEVYYSHQGNSLVSISSDSLTEEIHYLNSMGSADSSVYTAYKKEPIKKFLFRTKVYRTFNESNQLIETESRTIDHTNTESNYSRKFEWKEGNPVRVKMKLSSGIELTNYYTYLNEKRPSHFMTTVSELVEGKAPQNLVGKIVYQSGEIYTYTYTFDESRFPVEMHYSTLSGTESRLQITTTCWK